MQTIDVKLSFLKALSPKKKVGFQELCEQEIEKLPEHIFSLATQKMLILEMAYCLEKHQQWRHNTLLHHLLIHYIVKTYKIEARIIANFLAAVLRKAPAEAIAVSFLEERNFLLFIIVSALTARHEGLVADEIGLGSEVLLLIKNAVGKERGEEALEFAPTLTEESWLIIQDLAVRYKQKPWVFFLYKLGFLLSEAPAPWSEGDREQVSNIIFDLLCKIGEKKILSQARCEKLVQALDFMGKGKCRHLISGLMEYLCRCELVFLVHGHSQHRNLASYSLTREGYELTAVAFAHRNRKQIPKRSYFFSLERSWQEAFVRVCDTTVFPYLFSFLKEEPAPPSHCIEAIADRLVGHVERGELLTALQEIGQKAISTRVKEASEKATEVVLARTPDDPP
ncbi:MAG: hypothetical protein HYW48_04565 [Deltaproteobacteria bacterium]|nr:hypothetical protein [Deltaproteobacteria bacterium]